MTKRRDLRVALYFGTRSDAALVQELMQRSPYERAKFIHSLVQDGWRRRNGGTSLSINGITLNDTRAHKTPNGVQSTFDFPDESPLKNDILALLGKSVRW